MEPNARYPINLTMNNPLKRTLDESKKFIAENQLIMRCIMFHCDDITLRRCMQVNRAWYFIAVAVIHAKMKVLQCIVPFFFERQTPVLRAIASTVKQANNQSVKRSYNNLPCGKVKSPRSFMKEFLNLMKQSGIRPYYVIILEGIENQMLKDEQQTWTRVRVLNDLRSYLGEDCALVGIDAHNGIIGECSNAAPSTSKTPTALSYYVNGCMGISGLIFPKYDGVTITTFPANKEDCRIDPDVRALILLSSDFGKDFRNCLSSPQAQAIFNHYKGQIALAGAQIDSPIELELSHRANDDGHYYFINGPPPYDKGEHELYPTLAIQFSGPNCHAASLMINQKYSRVDPIFRRKATDVLIEELRLIKAKLKEFKSRLTFPCDSDDKYETIGFLFFNINCYRDYRSRVNRTNAGIEYFFRAFPHTLITGVLCHINYQHNYIPPKFDVEVELPEDRPNLMSDRCIASFILISMKKGEFNR